MVHPNPQPHTGADPAHSDTGVDQVATMADMLVPHEGITDWSRQA